MFLVINYVKIMIFFLKYIFFNGFGVVLVCSNWSIFYLQFKVVNVIDYISKEDEFESLYIIFVLFLVNDEFIIK